MMKSDKIERKFVATIGVNDFEVLTDDGFVEIVTINETIPYLKYIVKTENHIIECADDHILFNENMDEVFAKDINVGDFIVTDSGKDVVTEVVCTGEFENMFDLELSSDSNHRYYTNGILSHNTLLAKKLAKELFGDEKALVRFDMSEYSDKVSVNKLIGSNPGYVGYEEGGQLTETIKNKKHCVLLLDEIEKADPEVYNIFLQVLDEGFLTDNSGQRVDFKNVIVVFTSNVGAKTASEFGKGIGFSNNEEENTKRILLKQLKNRFPPEFLNRINDVIYFNALDDDNLSSIIRIEIGKLEDRLENMGYSMEYNDDVVKYILNKIQEEKDFGARPIIRSIQENIEDKLTDKLLENDYEKGYVFKISCPELSSVTVS